MFFLESFSINSQYPYSSAFTCECATEFWLNICLGWYLQPWIYVCLCVTSFGVGDYRYYFLRICELVRLLVCRIFVAVKIMCASILLQLVYIEGRLCFCTEVLYLTSYPYKTWYWNILRSRTAFIMGKKLFLIFNASDFEHNKSARMFMQHLRPAVKKNQIFFQ